MLDLFLDSNILINHFCEGDKFLCAQELLEKIGKGDFTAWVSDFVYSESLGELKDRLEKRKGLKVASGEVISRHERERMVGTIEDFKKIPNLNSVSIPLDQRTIYDRVKDYCFQAKDAPIVISVEELEKQLKREVYLVTADMNSLFFKAKRIVRPLHPSFHMDKCKPECREYSLCRWRNRFTGFSR